MEESRGGLYFLEDLVGGQESFNTNSFSPLSKVAVQGYLTNEQCNVRKIFNFVTLACFELSLREILFGITMITSLS